MGHTQVEELLLRLKTWPLERLVDVLKLELVAKGDYTSKEANFIPRFYRRHDLLWLVV